MDKVECVVIGAGVIGLAVARRLAQAGREVIVLEAAEGIGTVTSSRNSEVIHAGIYYPRRKPDGADVRQRQARALSLLRDHGIPHRNCGKLIVATTPTETEKLQSIRAHAEANGVLDMQLADRRGRARAGAGAELRRGPALALHRHHRQPRLHAGAARRCRGSRRGLRLSHAAAARQGGGRPDRTRAGGDAPMTLECNLLVNAAGLGAPAVARSIDGMPIELIPRPIWPREIISAAARGRRFHA
jgi:L-2-hydroxyglutarate oxidase LhgO